MKLFPCLAFAYALALAAAGCQRAAAEETHANPPEQPISRGPVWSAGQQHSYRTKLTSSLAFGEQSKSFDFDLHGELIVSASRAVETEASLFLAFAQARIESRVPDPEGQFRAVESELVRSGCYFDYENGLVTEVRLAPGSSPMVISIYRQLAAALQVTRPSADSTRFEAQEYDGTGRYTAEYRAAGVQGWHKQKRSYSELLGKTSGVAAQTLASLVPQIVASTGEIRLSDTGRPLHVELRDELRIQGAQLPVRSTTAIQLDAEGAPTAVAVKHWSELGERLTRLGVTEPYAVAASVEALDDARIRGATFESVVENLRTTSLQRAGSASPASDPTSAGAAEQALANQETSQFVALTAIFRQQEQAVAKAVRRARTDPRLAPTLVDALGSSGSAAAQSALAKMLTEKGLDPKLRVHVLTGLARTPTPSAVAVQALKDELGRDPFSTGALYGLGSHARYFGDQGDREQERALGELLIERLRQAGDVVPRLVVTLGGIANSGYLGALDAVGNHLADRRPRVRAAALRALQSMPGESIDELLAGAITSDADASVVVAAVAVIRVREPSAPLLEALMIAAEKGPDASVRYRSLEVLTAWSKGRSEVRAVVQRVAANDPEERVRSLAQASL